MFGPFLHILFEVYKRNVIWDVITLSSFFCKGFFRYCHLVSLVPPYYCGAFVCWTFFATRCLHYRKVPFLSLFPSSVGLTQHFSALK